MPVPRAILAHMSSPNLSPTTPPPADTEILIHDGPYRAVLSPWGASLRRFYEVDAQGREIDIVWGYSGAAQKRGGQGDVLIPFPGRVADGRYMFAGETFQLERNDKEGPNAIHGFVRSLPWQVTAQDASRLRCEVSLSADIYASKGYPFSVACAVTYAVSADGLRCTFEVRNVGARSAPVGVGFHPYLTIGVTPIDAGVVMIPAAAYLEFNERLVPTGRVHAVDGTDWDCRQPQVIGQRRFNHCYLQLVRDAQGLATATLRNPQLGRRIEVTMDRAFSAIVVYTGDAIPGAARQAVAIEPMTCGSDAFNHPDWGLRCIAPTEVFSGSYTIRHFRDGAGQG